MDKINLYSSMIFGYLDFELIGGIRLWNLVLAIVVCCIILFLRGVFARSILNLLRKILSKVTKYADQIIDSIKPCMLFAFVLIAFWSGFNLLALEKVFLFVHTVISGLLVFSVFWAVYRSVDVILAILTDTAEKTGTMLDNYLVLFSGKIIKIVLIAVGAVMVIQQWGFNVTTLIAGLGVGGLAIALAGQDFVSNLFGFLTIFMDRAFSEGDLIEASGVKGFVEEIGMRSVRVRTLDRSLVTVPNSTVASSSITNWAKADKRRYNFSIGVTYSSTADQMNELSEKFRNMLKEHPDIDDDYWVYFSDFGGSSMDIQFNFFTKTLVAPPAYFRIKHDINIKIMNLVAETGMEMAFPSSSIYLENLDNQAMKLMTHMKESGVIKK